MNKNLAMNGILAAVYAVATIMIAPISYGAVQFRLSEILIFFAFYNKKFIPGLVLGCIIANLWSPLGVVDVIFGTISTLLVCWLIYLAKKIWMVPLLAALITGVIIGTELYFVFELPLIETIFFVAFGELVVVTLGIPIFHYIEKNKVIKQILKKDNKWKSNDNQQLL